MRALQWPRLTRALVSRFYRKKLVIRRHSGMFPAPLPGTEGCTMLTGSDAGKLPTRPAWSAVRLFVAGSFGLSACLSCGAGSNLSAI